MQLMKKQKKLPVTVNFRYTRLSLHSIAYNSPIAAINFRII